MPKKEESQLDGHQPREDTDFITLPFEESHGLLTLLADIITLFPMINFLTWLMG
ncbi:hypothetical protein ABIB50_000614 [Mucilaginibacter sp. UYCu711]